MESAESLRCCVCKMKFDLTKRIPILTLCCEEVCCKDCWNQSLGQNCPLKCDGIIKDPQERPEILLHLLRAIEKKPEPSYVRCSLHLHQYCRWYEPFRKQLFCKKCESPGSPEQYEEFEREQVVKSTESMILWTAQVKQELEQIEKKLINVVRNEEPTSIDFLKISEQILEWKGWNGSKIRGYYQFHDRAKVLGNSSLLNSLSDKDYDLIKEGLRGKDFMLKPRYQATRDGFLSSVFQEKMDGCPKYLLVIKSSQDKIFGAYGAKTFKKGQNRCKLDIAAAVFSFTYVTVHFPYRNGEYSHNLHPDWIQTNADIFLANECNTNQHSYTDFGYTFKPPTTFKYGSEGCKQYLAGSHKFQVKEIEAFEVELK
ncbi:hypothetical protein FGO68_gene14559 [Halteria grandinella]|uniref:TLDc domain-containing protein n=1 Tax=Halteria grandinella TaxID=5974 RepID=A0A8J8T128_HALGN|nr:hypothetical protein FGO68_gene14559 [Halteria grandinella]